jgi:hypothetical protein
VQPKVTIRKALEDPALLGGVLGGETWKPWRVILIAAVGEPLDDDELVIFEKFTGRKLRPIVAWMSCGARWAVVAARAALWPRLPSIWRH